MKKLLVATDFSANATNAVTYGFALAKKLKVNLTICNAFSLPNEVPPMGEMVWFPESFGVASRVSADTLKDLKCKLETKHHDGYLPHISLVNQPGCVTDVIKDLAAAQQADMVIIGAHEGDTLSNFFFGNHCRQVIDDTVKPLLIVPALAQFKGVNKIAYTTDFKNPQDDLAAIYHLIRLAKLLDAEILLAHVTDQGEEAPLPNKWRDDLLTDLANKVDYPKITYQTVGNKDVQDGLDWLCQHNQIDVLTVQHRSTNCFNTIIKSSVTQKMANHSNVPLLVLPQQRI